MDYLASEAVASDGWWSPDKTDWTAAEPAASVAFTRATEAVDDQRRSAAEKAVRVLLTEWNVGDQQLGLVGALALLCRAVQRPRRVMGVEAVAPAMKVGRPAEWFLAAFERGLTVGTDDAWEALIDRLDERGYQVADPELDELVRQARKDMPGPAASGVARTIGMISRAPESLHVRAVMALGDLLEHRSARVRQAAVEALWEFQNEPSTALLKQALRDESDWVRRAAEVALQGR